MAKRKTVTDAASAASDLAEEASSLLRRLIDESQLRDAVASLIEEGHARAEELPSRGRRARKQAKKQLKAARKQASQQLTATRKKAEKQQKKLARKGAAAAAEGRELVKQNKPGIKGRLVLVLAGTVGALAVSETLRSKVLDLLFGAEEEFQYTPPEPPAQGTSAPLSAA
ncbi:MAG TPA: hypothetical protein VFN48_01940 [Solirubrobacteraceae bacterium]|nr:hypothetical protein [Solirubrobacteraceae bacterium]